MKVAGFNLLSIGCKKPEESVKFYETVLGMEPIPSYNFGFRTKKQLSEFAAQNQEGLRASLYLDRPHLKPARRASQ
jgi:catechol 2,3-dioxygenase-like lactoylglutathione lyase family enzyme